MAYSGFKITRNIPPPPPTPPSPENYDAAVLADNPIYFWKFNEASGNLINYGSYGGSTSWAEGGTRQARTVGGFTGVANFNNNRFVPAGLNNSGWTLGHTAEAIVVVDDTGSNTIVGERQTSSGDDINLYLGAGRYSQKWSITASVSSGLVRRADSINNQTPGQVIHLVGVHDYVAQELRLYVNGVLEGSLGSTPKVTDSNEFYIGGSVGTGAAEFNGAMGRVAIYGNKVLTDAQVADHYSLAPMT